MPFICSNTTDVDGACSTLLKYCNNNYGSEISWCNCISYKYDDKCGINYGLVIGLPLGLCLPVIFAFIGVLIYNFHKDKKNKAITNNSNVSTELPPNDYPQFLQPIETCIRKNRTTNLEPMKIEDVNEDCPDLEKGLNADDAPPPYNISSGASSIESNI